MNRHRLPNAILLIGLALLLVPPPPARAAGTAKGLAMAESKHMEDLAALGVAWWYVWGWCEAPGCVPMVRAMQLPPSCPPRLLVGNEPNAVEPYGSPASPAGAVENVLAIEAKCPHTALVVGNVSYDDWSAAGGWGSAYNWISQFLHEYRAQAGRPFSQAIGVHCYAQTTAGYCIKGLARLRSLYKGPMWVTEFGVVSGHAAQFSRLVDFVASHFDRYAAYTNRQPHAGYGWESGPGVELVNGDGSLSPAGAVYADK